MFWKSPNIWEVHGGTHNTQGCLIKPWKETTKKWPKFEEMMFPRWWHDLKGEFGDVRTLVEKPFPAGLTIDFLCEVVTQPELFCISLGEIFFHLFSRYLNIRIVISLQRCNKSCSVWFASSDFQPWGVCRKPTIDVFLLVYLNDCNVFNIL